MKTNVIIAITCLASYHMFDLTNNILLDSTGGHDVTIFFFLFVHNNLFMNQLFSIVSFKVVFFLLLSYFYLKNGNKNIGIISKIKT
jgi:hypothetical protein